MAFIWIPSFQDLYPVGLKLEDLQDMKGVQWTKKNPRKDWGVKMEILNPELFSKRSGYILLEHSLAISVTLTGSL